MSSGSTLAPAEARVGRYVDRVRWSDVDAAGIVCYGRYLRYFEGAEEDLFRSAGLPAEGMLHDHGVWLVRRRVSAEFIRPVRLGEPLATTARVSRIGDTSLELEFLATSDGQPVASGAYLLVCVDRESLRPLRVPEAMRIRLGGGPAQQA
jgi:acyl-CoA thioester hydrolase